ncbi:MULTISPECIES: lipoprotein-releasing ABC transporter permease subunit [Mesorhizobium]|uniref:Lipoprotein-releasing ABC transporter permease subunit n=3 Tax=Phyllobacteriaceae TaxID=69277 RepID=A0ABU5ALQ0_9HYPH|nr:MULTISPECIES: lipoprotein-releasing ABC transporter permease subunit [Mesorhizobium]MDX8434966.1 lipoprotein-releasing ABC transporter permease subunit [Mesorhizobium abyssinicae]MDX8538157.1 lipoprotein-releasing ABC transporter permease subunit [Mesorhizobium abyssinicae]RUW22182.1 lipoprotein-releasing ABC transporter permease subunit [Mesorhizobium sp. M4B.F.Ca.ET.013.02.1.1]RUW77936.1 lipoprotein-releasing ABC transporter permease subunit [Mesorhizobium sp. M4B.F.Ca.ET.049.02.1.2]RVD21
MSQAAAAKAPAVKAPAAGAFSVFERMVAWRYLRSRRKETVISVIASISFLGIMLGVATLIVVMAVMNGFRAELLTRILGVNGHLIAQPLDSPLEDYAQVAGRINGVAGVKYAIPLIDGQVLAQGNVGGGTGALVRGIRGEDLGKISIVSSNIRQGTLDGFDTGEGVAIGKRMAENLGLVLGDTITLISPDGDVTPLGTTPRMKGYKIAAIFEVGMSEYDSSIVYMPFSEAQLYFNMDGRAQTIEIYVDNPDNVDALKPLVEQAAQRPIDLVDWRQRNETFFSALQVERNVMFMILTLIVLVAALNIISGLVMLVKDKGHDIAILRTMGATRGAILRIFLMTGAAIGVTGTIAGVLLGVVICLNIESIRQFFSWMTGRILFNPELYFLSQLPAKMDARETTYVVIMALGLSFLATVFPAWRAARLDPVEALRYE